MFGCLLRNAANSSKSATYLRFSSDVPYQIIFPHSYSLTEEELILGKLNSCDISDLKRYAITSTRSKRLLAHRKKHGEFENLNQVLAVEGFGAKVLKSLCQSILDPPSENEQIPAKRTKNYNFVTPELTQERLERIQRVVGVSLGTFSLSWAGIDLGVEKCFCWGHHTLCMSPDVKRHHETHILEAVYDAHQWIPEADTYVMESYVPSRLTQQAGCAQVNQQRLQMSSMLLVLLNQAARDRSEQQCVFYQRNSLWCRLYGTLVGTERVSTQNSVEDMLGGAPGPYTPIHMPDNLVEGYYAETPVVREALGSALLLTTSFIDVNVRKLPECLSLLRGGIKREK